MGRVLAPVDFKDDSVADVRAAAALAQSLDVPLLLVHVVAPLKGLDRLRPQLDTHNRVQIERAERQIKQLASDLAAPAGIEIVVAVGSPAEEIARIAVTRGAGLIVMGLRSHERMVRAAARVRRLSSSELGAGKGIGASAGTDGRGVATRAGGNPILILSYSRSRASHFILKQPITFCNRSIATGAHKCGFRTV